VMLVNPAKCPSVKEDLGQQFIDLLISPEGQKIISGYKINGQQLFYPNANDPNAWSRLDAAVDLIFPVVLAAIAAAYAAVGQAGATGYIAAMGIVGFTPDVIRPAALALNTLAAAVGTVRFGRAGHLTWRGTYPFIILGVKITSLANWARTESSVSLHRRSPLEHRMISMATICRCLGRWLIGLFVIAQIFGVVPLLSGEIVHAAESELALANGGGNIPLGHHHHGDGCAQQHELQHLTGVFRSELSQSEVSLIPGALVALAPDALTENDTSRLERPPKPFLSIWTVRPLAFVEGPAFRRSDTDRMATHV
jgi:hypothetical protein